MGFGKWPDEIHYEVSQLKRINSALQIKDKNIKALDKENKTAIIIGSSGVEYDVTLNSCTCFDFGGQRPCKHIYRLAAECNLLPPLPVVNPEKAKAFENKVPGIIEEYKKLYFDGAITADKFFKIVNALNTKMKIEVEPKKAITNKSNTEPTLYAQIKAVVDTLPSHVQLLLWSMLTEQYLKPVGSGAQEAINLLLEKGLLLSFPKLNPSAYEIVSRFTLSQLNEILKPAPPYKTRGLMQDRILQNNMILEILLKKYNSISADDNSDYVNYYWPEIYADKRSNIIKYLEKKPYSVEDVKKINLPEHLVQLY